MALILGYSHNTVIMKKCFIRCWKYWIYFQSHFITILHTFLYSAHPIFISFQVTVKHILKISWNWISLHFLISFMSAQVPINLRWRQYFENCLTIWRFYSDWGNQMTNWNTKALSHSSNYLVYCFSCNLISERLIL